MRFSSHPIQKIIFEDLKSTRARAPRSLKTARKVLGKTHSRRSSEELEDDFRSTWKPALLGYEELEGLLGIDPQVPARKTKSDSY
jgi:hypothetical protein